MSLYFFFKRHSAVLIAGLLLLLAVGFFLASTLFSKKQNEETYAGAQNTEKIVMEPTEENKPLAALPTADANQGTAISLPQRVEDSKTLQPELAVTQNTVMHLPASAPAPQATQNAGAVAMNGSTDSAVPAMPVNPPAAINQPNVVSSATQLTEAASTTVPSPAPQPAPVPQTAAAPGADSARASQQKNREAAEALLNTINEEAGIQIDLRDQPDQKISAATTASTKDKPQPLKPAAAKAPKTTLKKDTPLKSLVIIHPREQAKTAAVKSTSTKGSYTIQFIGLRSREEASRFIQIHKLANAKIVPVKVNSQVLYVVVRGDFNSMASAKNAASNLPASLKQLHPWVRSIDSLQAARIQPAALPSEKKAAVNTEKLPIVEQKGLF